MKVLFFVLRLLASTIVIASIIVVTQDIQIFPSALFSLFNSSERDPSTLPKKVESVFVSTEDDERLELWRFEHPEVPPKGQKVAIVFHGNAGDVGNFFAYQYRLSSLGLVSYGFDYRGYGKSSGWPTEQGLYADGRAVARYVMDREGIEAKDLVLVGVSLGTGPAAQLARELDVGTLLLVAPFSSLKDVVKATPLFGLLHPFLFYKFPVKENVATLQSTCVVVAHGEADRVIPFEQGRSVFQVVPRQLQSAMVTLEDAGHNDIFFSAWGDVASALGVCVDKTEGSVRQKNPL
jgi:hypothetical protein